MSVNVHLFLQMGTSETTSAVYWRARKILKDASALMTLDLWKFIVHPIQFWPFSFPQKHFVTTVEQRLEGCNICNVGSEIQFFSFCPYITNTNMLLHVHPILKSGWGFDKYFRAPNRRWLILYISLHEWLEVLHLHREFGLWKSNHSDFFLLLFLFFFFPVLMEKTWLLIETTKATLWATVDSLPALFKQQMDQSSISAT